MFTIKGDATSEFIIVVLHQIEAAHFHSVLLRFCVMNEH